jgi:hypothetical protein
MDKDVAATLDDTIPPPLRVPNVWRAMDALREAWEMIERNPDLVGMDLELALQSETPTVVSLLDALVASYHHSQYVHASDDAYAKVVALRAQRSKAVIESRKALLIGVLQKLNLKSHRAPAGSVSWAYVRGPTVITDETLVPDAYRHPPKPGAPDLRKIREALDAGQDVPGAMCGNGGTSLTLRP